MSFIFLFLFKDYHKISGTRERVNHTSLETISTYTVWNILGERKYHKKYIFIHANILLDIKFPKAGSHKAYINSFMNLYHK